MRWKMTEEQFKNLVDWKAHVKDRGRCKKGVRHGRFSGISGHEHCSSCPGNYYNGGECNFGGHHVLKNELERINRNFEGFEVLNQEYKKLKLTQNMDKGEFESEKNRLINNFGRIRDRCNNNQNSFLSATCVGVDGDQGKFRDEVKERFNKVAKKLTEFINSIKNLTLIEVEEFQAKLKQIEDLKQQNTNLWKEYKTASPKRKAQIDATISENEKTIQSLSDQLNNHSARSLFDPKVEAIIGNLAKWTVTGEGDGPNNLGRKRGSTDWGRGSNNNTFTPKNNNEENTQNNNAWPIGQILFYGGLGVVGIIVLIIAYFAIKKSFSK